jgi:hypothetical protein
VARSFPLRGSVVVVVSLAAAALALLLAARAGAYIYWANEDGNHPERISRANNNGSHVQAKFIADAKSSPDAVTTDRRHVYWVSGLDSIGRARINGSKVDPKFITHAGGFLRDLVVSDGYIYWTNDDDPASIGRARVNGSDVETQFITLDDPDHVLRFDAPLELAVAGDYLYWANAYRRYAIGRARLDGSDVDQEFIYVPPHDPYAPGRLHNPFGLAATDSYVYWSNRGSKSIGRAATDGSDINVEFIPGVGKYVSSLAVDDDYLYWDSPDGRIMRSRLDGTQIKGVVRAEALTVFVDRLGS